MKSLVQSQTFRETVTFMGLLGAAVLLSTLLGDLTFAEAISNEDQIDYVSDLTGGESDLKDLINTILSYFLSFLGFVCVIMVIYGGILYVTSAGNDENVAKAKKILLYAAIGVVLIMISFAVVNTLLGAASDGPGTSGTTTTVQ